MKTKFEKVYDSDKTIVGYKLGNNYLMKIWGSGNTYSWVINDEPECFYFDTEFFKRLEEGKLYFVDNCKQGKEELLRLAKEVY